ncbi:ThuA domain-containing protein [Herbiconiux sp. UC225_62]|uniref:ThuA domain-containing protein n=1 Tax=Herbiconiux sp. UC225_62 TaxID=3350168 RepID=UPI0036D3E597
MRSIVVVSGEQEHSDPWHGLAGTSAVVAEVLSPLGAVRTVGTGATELAEAITSADVVVLNVSGDLAADPADSSPVVDLLEAHLAEGKGILALHSSSLAFSDDPRWSDLLGGRWEPGVTMHPQIGHALVQATDEGRDLLAGFDDFVLYDERYTALETRPGGRVLAEHTEDGLTHPLVWTREGADDRGRVAYDALGHGVESYDSAEHRRLLAELLDWVDARD